LVDMSPEIPCAVWCQVPTGKCRISTSFMGKSFGLSVTNVAPCIIAVVARRRR